MKQFLLLAAVFLGFSQSSLYDRPALSPRNANYDITVRLESEEKTVSGSETIRWKNISSKATDELWFHLYLNAFSSFKSTFAAESGGQLRGVKMSDKDFGHQRIGYIAVNNQDMTSRLEFRQPDDGNPFDSTVVMLKLDYQIEPQDSVEIRIDFVSKLPKVAARTGFINNDETQNYFLVGQWFPKIAVLEEKGWNSHQFHGNTEFYADYGVYDVKLNVPKDFVVGASGELLAKTDKEDGYQEHHYFVSDVHDFAWTAYPKFQEAWDEHNGVKLRLLYNEEQTEQHVKEQFQSVKYALDYYGEHYGKYAHPTLTMVNAPKGGEGSNGMEYPTFITCGYSEGLPDGVLFRSEFVTIHEFGHQIFQGIIGSNEFEHSWMDEGLNSYGDAGTVDRYYEGAVALPFLKVKGYDIHRIAYLMKPNFESVMTTSYKQYRQNYGTNTYSKPAILLKSLENYLGKEKMTLAMQHYFQKWKFKHPYPKDFFEAINEKTDEDITWFFQQFFYENKVTDYDVTNISYRKIKKERFTQLKAVQLATNTRLDDSSKPIYLNTISIQNHGNGYMPMDLLVTLENGEELRNLKWNYKALTNVIRFYSNSQLKSAQLDPERKILLDLNYYNNGKEYHSPKVAAKFTNRFLFWMQNALQLIVGL